MTRIMNLRKESMERAKGLYRYAAAATPELGPIGLVCCWTGNAGLARNRVEYPGVQGGT